MGEIEKGDQKKKKESKVQRLRRYEDRLQEVLIQREVPLMYDESDVHTILNYKNQYYSKKKGAENLLYMEFDVEENLRSGFLS